MLPGTDGIKLMQNVPELAELPVIFISGYGRDEAIARALEAGAVDYIVKPLLADRADGADPGGAAPARRPRAVRAGRACHRLRPAVGHHGRARGRAHRHRVQAAAAPSRSTPDGSRPPRRCWTGSGPGGATATPRSCAPSSSSSARSSATTRRTRPGSSTCAASATACPGRAPRASPDLDSPDLRQPCATWPSDGTATSPDRPRYRRAAFQVRKCIRRRWLSAPPYSNRKRLPCGSTTPIGAGPFPMPCKPQRDPSTTNCRPHLPAPAQYCQVAVVRAPPRAVTPRKEQRKAPPASALSSRPSPRERTDAPRATAVPSGANCGQAGSVD